MVEIEASDLSVRNVVLFGMELSCHETKLRFLRSLDVK